MTVIYDMSNEEYHLDPSLSASGAKKIAMESLADFKYGEYQPSAAFDVGSATHTLILEPHRSNTVWCGPETRRGKAWTDAKDDADAAGAILLTESDYALAKNMADAVRANAAAAALLSGDLVCEASVFAIDANTNVNMRCRPDAWRKDIAALIDVKTTVDSSPAGFAKQAANFGYHIQDQFYRRCMAFDGHEIDRFIFIAVQKKAPFKVGVYELDLLSLEEGHHAVEYALAAYATAQHTGVWGYDYGELQTLQIPPYAFKFSEAT